MTDITAQPWTEREQAIYEIGHREGEGCQEHQWQFALTEYCDLPDDVNVADPVQVAEYIARLQDAAPDPIRHDPGMTQQEYMAKFGG